MSACQNCQAVRINGVLCHETGCPTSYIGKTLECSWCGTKFKIPEDEKPIAQNGSGKTRYFCSEDCREAFQ